MLFEDAIDDLIPHFPSTAKELESSFVLSHSRDTLSQYRNLHTSAGPEGSEIDTASGLVHIYSHRILKVMKANSSACDSSECCLPNIESYILMDSKVHLCSKKAYISLCVSFHNSHRLTCMIGDCKTQCIQ